MTILFCNVGGMERYQGLHAGDQIIGGGAYVKKKGRGHEVCNFSCNNNTLYGYVQPPGKQIDIDRIGASPGNDSISGVTIVWTATRPIGGTAVIGWYRNATVFRKESSEWKIVLWHASFGVPNEDLIGKAITTQ